MLAASASSAQNCADCIQIPRKDFELAKKAADEAASSRVLIAKQEREIELLQENGTLKDRLIEQLKENGRLKDERLTEKEQTIIAERQAREATEKQLALETKERVKAQRSAKLWRKIGTFAGAAAAALILMH